MLGSVGSIVPKRWVLGIAALGLIALMVATSANHWAGAATLPSSASAVAASPTSITVTWTPADSGSTLPASGTIPAAPIDGYKIDCVSSSDTVSNTVTGVATSSATTTGLNANTAYVCTVFPVVGTTLTGSGVAASSVTTPASTSTQLASVTTNISSAIVQVGGKETLTATLKATDGTVLTGITVNWTSSSSNGTLSASTGSSVTYTAASAGSATITASATQSGSGITKSTTIAVTNFSPPPPAPPPPPPVDPTDPAVIPVAPSLGGETQAASAVIKPSTGANIVIPPPATDDADFSFATDVTVSIPVNAVPNGKAFGVVVELVPKTGATTAGPDPVDQSTFVPLPENVNDVPAEAMTVQLTDADGNAVTGVTFNEPVTIGITVKPSDLQGAGQDPQSVSVYKATNPATGPWIKFVTAFSFTSDGKYLFKAQTTSFSTFKLGSESRSTGLPAAGGGAVLPATGDIVPSTTQVLLLTGLGLLLMLGGGVYIRRQRMARTER